MAELEEKLNAILGNPEAMGQIVSIAKALSGGEESGENQSGRDADAAEAAGEQTDSTPSASDEGQGGQTDWSALLGLLGGGGGSGDSPLSLLGSLDPKLIQSALTLFSEYSASDDRKVALLNALKPFLKAERQSKVDRAIQIARLSRVIRVAFQLFRKEGGQEDV